MPKDRKPIFNVEAHTYKDPKDGFEYTSVTRWVGQFKPKFDENYWAAKIAQRECVPVDVILEEWDRIRTTSQVFGTSVHKMLEVYLTTKKVTDKRLEPILESFKKLKIKFNKDTFFEKLVYNRKLGIAGTSDIIMHNEDGKTFDVYDFKTNKKFRYESEFEEELLTPLTGYPASEYFTYALQLSMYAYLYKHMSGLTPRRLKVFWYQRYHNITYVDLTGDWRIINLPYMEEELVRCIEHEPQKIVA